MGKFFILSIGLIVCICCSCKLDFLVNRSDKKQHVLITTNYFDSTLYSKSFSVKNGFEYISEKSSGEFTAVSYFFKQQRVSNISSIINDCQRDKNHISEKQQITLIENFYDGITDTLFYQKGCDIIINKGKRVRKLFWILYKYQIE